VGQPVRQEGYATFSNTESFVDSGIAETTDMSLFFVMRYEDGTNGRPGGTYNNPLTPSGGTGGITAFPNTNERISTRVDRIDGSASLPLVAPPGEWLLFGANLPPSSSVWVENNSTGERSVSGNTSNRQITSVPVRI